MNKKLFLCSLLCILAFPVSAGYFDLAVTLGANVHMNERDLDPSRMKLAWGLSTGLTDVWEFTVQVDNQLVPYFFQDASISLLTQRTLFGQRSTGSRTAGVGINTLLGMGVMFSEYREQGTFGLSHVLFSVTPLTVGSPVMGKRERLLTLTLAYNLSTGGIGILFDLIKYDFYLVGSYKDYL